MITSFAQFLEELQAKEAAVLAKEVVKHGPTIGDMYEGLTRELLERAIPEALNLRLVEGFVVGVDGQYSHQTDAMLVMGNKGSQIPKTDKWAWPIEDVLAVFEVKKNLYAADLSDSIAKMRVVSLQQKDLLSSEKKKIELGPSRYAFARAMGRFPKAGELEDLDNPGGEILRTIAHEQLAPVRVVFGYEGYADEYGLRTAFLDALQAVEDGIAGPAVLPNLIICRKNALIKLTGHPYIARLRETEEWDLVGSTREAPFVLLLELLWSRLANEFHAQFPVDDTLDLEAIVPLLTGKPVRVEEKRGWYFYAKQIGKTQLAEVVGERWEPFELRVEEFALFRMAMSHGGLRLADEPFVEAAEEGNVDLRAFADRMVEARLFVWKSEGVAYPISETIHQVTTPDGRFWLSPNHDLLMLWIAENHPTR